MDKHPRNIQRQRPDSNSASKKLTKKKFWFCIGVMLIISVISVVVFVYMQSNSAKKSNITVEEVTEYPQEFKEAQIPKYPHGEITSGQLSQERESKGISVLITTRDTPAEVSDFFAKELAARGWKSDGGVATADIPSSVQSTTYTRNDKELSVTSSLNRETNGTFVTLVYSRK